MGGDQLDAGAVARDAQVDAHRALSSSLVVVRSTEMPCASAERVRELGCLERQAADDVKADGVHQVAATQAVSSTLWDCPRLG